MMRNLFHEGITMRPWRIYADTSVLGGCEDPEFQVPSLAFIRGVREGRYTLLITDVVLAELEQAPNAVKERVAALPPHHIERIELTAEVLSLRDAYPDAGILDSRWAGDATHVAAATIARADAIISWNFRHIVRLDKMKQFNQLNLLQGYGILTILSPLELGGEYDGPQDV